MRHVTGKMRLAAAIVVCTSAQAQTFRPSQAKSAISTEIDFNRPGGTYQRSTLPLGAGGSMFAASEQCKIGCYNSNQCRAYAVHRVNGAALCEMKNAPSKPAYMKGYVSGRRIPPVRIDNGSGEPPTEADSPFGVAACRRLELKCPGPSELAVVRGSCVCQVKRLNTPIEVGPVRQ